MSITVFLYIVIVLSAIFGRTNTAVAGVASLVLWLYMVGEENAKLAQDPETKEIYIKVKGRKDVNISKLAVVAVCDYIAKKIPEGKKSCYIDLNPYELIVQRKEDDENDDAE